MGVLLEAQELWHESTAMYVGAIKGSRTTGPSPTPELLFLWRSKLSYCILHISKWLELPVIFCSNSMSASFNIGSTFSWKTFTLLPDPLNGLIRIRSLRQEGNVLSSTKYTTIIIIIDNQFQAHSKRHKLWMNASCLMMIMRICMWPWVPSINVAPLF